MMAQLSSPPVITSVDIPSILATNPALGHYLVAALLASASETGAEPYLDVLKYLPPILPSFDLIGRLLRDSTIVADVSTGGRTTIADLVRTEVLGWFLHQCVTWLDRAEHDEREGNISDDRFPKGVQNVRPVTEVPWCAPWPTLTVSHSSVVFITHLLSWGSSTPPQTRTLPRWRTSRCATRGSMRRTRSIASSPWASSEPQSPEGCPYVRIMMAYAPWSAVAVIMYVYIIRPLLPCRVLFCPCPCPCSVLFCLDM